jgi:hypothetical protein
MMSTSMLSDLVRRAAHDNRDIKIAAQRLPRPMLREPRLRQSPDLRRPTRGTS